MGVLGGAVTSPSTGFMSRQNGSLWMCSLRYPTGHLARIMPLVGGKAATTVSPSGGWMNHQQSNEALSTQDGPTACHMEIHTCPTLDPVRVLAELFLFLKKTLYLGVEGISTVLWSLAVSLIFLCYILITTPGAFQSVSQGDRYSMQGRIFDLFVKSMPKVLGPFSHCVGLEFPWPAAPWKKQRQRTGSYFRSSALVSFQHRSVQLHGRLTASTLVGDLVTPQKTWVIRLPSRCCIPLGRVF